MNPIEIYMRAMRQFNQPYFSMMEAYAGFLRQAGASQSQLTTPELADAAPPRSTLTRRAMAAAAAPDATKKELAATVQPASPERSGKTPAASNHLAGVERAKRAWATRRANAAADEKAARKAARAKARARKAR
jgi:hypothetical protein